MNVNDEEILQNGEEEYQNGEEENQNENGSSKEKKSAKKVVTKKQPAKAKQINIKTETQKKEASSVATTMLFLLSTILRY